MSPANRANPDGADDAGRFAWDVVAGYYKVRAASSGCVAVDHTAEYAETPVLTIPPPALDLDLVLDCAFTQFVGVVGSVVDGFGFSLVSADDTPGLTGQAVFDVSCQGGHHEQVTLAVEQGIEIGELFLGDVCTVTVVSAGGLRIEPPTRIVQVQPYTVDETWFVADVADLSFEGFYPPVDNPPAVNGMKAAPPSPPSSGWAATRASTCSPPGARPRPGSHAIRRRRPARPCDGTVHLHLEDPGVMVGDMPPPRHRVP